jgi:Inositol monophosphatase family
MLDTKPGTISSPLLIIRLAVYSANSFFNRARAGYRKKTPDDRSRLSCDVLWVVDPIDGAREFVDGIAAKELLP